MYDTLALQKTLYDAKISLPSKPLPPLPPSSSQNTSVTDLSPRPLKQQLPQQHSSSPSIIVQPKNVPTESPQPPPRRRPQRNTLYFSNLNASSMYATQLDPHRPTNGASSPDNNPSPSVRPRTSTHIDPSARPSRPIRPPPKRPPSNPGSQATDVTHPSGAPPVSPRAINDSNDEGNSL